MLGTQLADGLGVLGLAEEILPQQEEKKKKKKEKKQKYQGDTPNDAPLEIQRKVLSIFIDCRIWPLVIGVGLPAVQRR